jgi:hypothetical protein
MLTDDLGCWRRSEFKFKKLEKKTEFKILRLLGSHFIEKREREICQEISYKMLLNLP